MATTKKDPIPSLKDYITDKEGSRLSESVVLVRVTYPDAESHQHTGKYSGITVTPGPLGCVWSDGRTD